MITSFGAAVLYVGAAGLFGVKFWSSLRGMEMQSAGTLWTTSEGWRIYTLSKVTPTLAGLSVLAASALLGAPPVLLYVLAGWVCVIVAITLAALRSHGPRISAARKGADGREYSGVTRRIKST